MFCFALGGLVGGLFGGCSGGGDSGGLATDRPATAARSVHGRPQSPESAMADEEPRSEAPAPAELPGEPPAPLARALVKLIVLGDYPRHTLDAIEAALRSELEVEVERIEDVPLPREAYYPPRRRYRADRLLTFLNGHLEGEPATTRVLGLTAVDISTTKGRHRDWGVFGLGELGGRSCVVSSYRLSERGRRSDELVTFRVVTTAVHEVGHTLGLEHCTDPLGVMRDAEGSIRTVDTSDGHLGPYCRRRIEETAPRVLPYRP
ncbi:MAG: hypothetical protein JRH11_01115 [Deltaproteobacteria bacterium]|nr:hypothetical protein [Deltaproteobacteria bacterium]